MTFPTKFTWTSGHLFLRKINFVLNFEKISFQKRTNSSWCGEDLLTGKEAEENDSEKGQEVPSCHYGKWPLAKVARSPYSRASAAASFSIHTALPRRWLNRPVRKEEK
jgi:hypothetical protein